MRAWRWSSSTCSSPTRNYDSGLCELDGRPAPRLPRVGATARRRLTGAHRGRMIGYTSVWMTAVPVRNPGVLDGFNYGQGCLSNDARPGAGRAAQAAARTARLAAPVRSPQPARAPGRSRNARFRYALVRRGAGRRRARARGDLAQDLLRAVRRQGGVLHGGLRGRRRPRPRRDPRRRPRAARPRRAAARGHRGAAAVPGRRARARAAAGRRGDGRRARPRCAAATEAVREFAAMLAPDSDGRRCRWPRR